MRIKVEDFDLNSILFSGACFRAVLEEDGSITNLGEKYGNKKLH